MKRTLAAVLIASSFLSGCSTIVSATRENPIQDDPGKRTFGSYVQDEVLETKIMVNISKGSAALADSHVNITSFNGQILITGQVPDETTKQEASQIASQFREVVKIHNELEIAGPTTAVIRTNDAYITSRVKLALFGDETIPGGRIKVLTENGTVYLMGLLSQAQANTAVNAIRGVSGVRKIVKVFEYIGG